MKILFITAASHTKDMKNYNHFQRVYFLSRWADLSILALRNSDFSVSARKGTIIIKSWLSNKTASIIYFLGWILAKGRKGNYDIVLTEPSILSLCGFWAKIALNVKWVVDIWDIPVRCQSHHPLIKLKTRGERLLLKTIYKKADHFIVSISPDYELEGFRLPQEKMLLLKNAIWLKDLRQKNASFSIKRPFCLICTRSGYSIDSGLDILAKAYKEISQRLDVSLTIVGRIPAKLKNDLDDLEGCPTFYHHQFVPHESLLQMISNASACIIPYKDVPDLAQIYPVKLVEYLALGKAIIAPDMGIFSKVIKHGWNGLLFRPGDFRDLADKIEILYSEPELREKISLNAKNTIDDDFDCENKNRKILILLRELVKKKEI